MTHTALIVIKQFLKFNNTTQALFRLSQNPPAQGRQCEKEKAQITAVPRDLIAEISTFTHP
jgi:hypothetical protein